MTDDVEEVKRKRALRDDRERHSSAEFGDVLDTYSGRAVLHEILKECDIDAHIPSHEYETHRALGRREIGLWLKDKILTVNSKSVIIMENEHRKREADLTI